VLLLNECLLLFISLSTQSGNFWIHPRMHINALYKGRVSVSVCSVHLPELLTDFGGKFKSIVEGANITTFQPLCTTTP
jgi:hypothetical protein